MNKEELKQYIDDNIYENQDGEITGEALNEVLKAIVDDGGTEVEANPAGEATETLGKLKIGETIYTAPQGPQGEPGEDGQDGQPGPANTLTIGTVTDGEQAAASITGEAPNQQLNLVLPKGEQGDPGQNAVNPFKGWFTTDNIPTTGQEGDYCNVSDTSVTPHTVTIYRWNTTTNQFEDTGEVPDTATGETFASSETLQEVAIDDKHLVNPVNTADPTKPVLARAEDVMQLKAKLEGVTASESKVNAVVGTNVTIGEYVSGETGNLTVPSSNVSNYAYFEISIPTGTRFIRFNGGIRPSSSYKTGYSLGHIYNGEFVADRNFYFPVSTSVTSKEVIVEVKEGEDVFRTTCMINDGIQINDFYCYLQSGTSVGEELADKASYSDLEGLWWYQKNLFNVNEFENKRLTYSSTGAGSIDDGSGWLSNKLYLEEGVEYTVSNVVCNNTTDKYIFIAVFDSEDNLLKVRNLPGATVVIDSSSSTDYSSICHATFVYDSHWYTEQSYIRIQIRRQYTVGDYTKAQLEIGNTPTSFATYNSVKKFDIAKESSLEQVQENVDSNTGRIESLESQIGVNEYQVDLNTISKERYGVDGSTGNYVSVQGNTRSSVIPILKDKGNILKITANSNIAFTIAFLSAQPTVGNPLPFAVGYPNTILAAKGKTDEFEIVYNESIKYIYILRNNQSGTDTSPAEICYVNKKELNILAIGNSNDITELAYVPPILQQLLPDYHISLYVAYVGFGTIKDHLYMYDNDIAYNGSETTVGAGVTKNAYVYCWRYGRYYETKLTGMTLEELLTIHKWDIVKFITQRSDEYALVNETYDDDENHNGTTKEQFITNCKKLLNILRSKLNYGFKFVTNIGGVAYTQESEYINTLKEGCKILKNDVGVDFIIPDSLATTIARSNSDLAAISGGQYSLLFSDNNHLNAGFPCLLTAYTAIECILRHLHINKSIYDSTLWIPTNDNAEAIGAQATSEPNAGSNRRMTYGVSLGIEEDGEIIQSNILAAKEIAVIANNIMPELPEDDYILPPVVLEPGSDEESE